MTVPAATHNSSGRDSQQFQPCLIVVAAVSLAGCEKIPAGQSPGLVSHPAGCLYKVPGIVGRGEGCVYLEDTFQIKAGNGVCGAEDGAGDGRIRTVRKNAGWCRVQEYPVLCLL